MIRWSLLTVGVLSWMGSAHAERYLLEIPLLLNFDTATAPHSISIECYLGRRPFWIEKLRFGGGGRVSRIPVTPQDLDKREGAKKDWWPLGVRGVVFRRISVKKHRGSSVVRLAYECAGRCKRRYYLCHIPEVSRYLNLSSSSVTVIRGVVGSKRPVEPKPGLLDSPPTPGEGMVNTWSTVDPRGSACRLDIECNSMSYEGRCVKGRCEALLRGSCSEPRQTTTCVTHSTRQQGWQTCAPVYISGKAQRWGDCQVSE